MGLFVQVDVFGTLRKIGFVFSNWVMATKTLRHKGNLTTNEHELTRMDTEANFSLHRIKRASAADWETAFCSKPLAVLEASFGAQSWDFVHWLDVVSYVEAKVAFWVPGLRIQGS